MVNKYYTHWLIYSFLAPILAESLFQFQAMDLKKIIKKFNPKEVVIDTNGLGVGLGDEMIRPSMMNLVNIIHLMDLSMMMNIVSST